MPALENTYALILAGGSGTRFWPLSRNAKPKQLLDLFGTGTLLEQTIRRLDGLVPLENILILTNADQEAAVRECCPMLPYENIVAEPAKRDTAAAIALGAGWIARRAQNATMVVLPADHLIRDTAAFQDTIKVGTNCGFLPIAFISLNVNVINNIPNIFWQTNYYRLDGCH